MNYFLPKIVLTLGEPAGIGPDIVIKIAQQTWSAELMVVGDGNLLISRARVLNLPLNLIPFNADPLQGAAHQPGTLKIIPVALSEPCIAGQLNIQNVPYVLSCLEYATDLCLQGKAQALVTGPIHKGIINQANLPFTGHTEFLAAYCNSPQVLMLFVTSQAKVALATTHLPLADVPKSITISHLQKVLRLLHQALQNTFGVTNPLIGVCGLNPHAGEQGYLGSEEIETITPALNSLREENIQLLGPLPADTIFTRSHLRNVDAILAMYHDQALPVVKYMDFGAAVNVTLGLPIIRTSVDHGTALDKAGTLQADASSLAAAIQLAIQLASNQAK